jgi:hypothetical protein
MAVGITQKELDKIPEQEQMKDGVLCASPLFHAKGDPIMVMDRSGQGWTVGRDGNGKRWKQRI